MSTLQSQRKKANKRAAFSLFHKMNWEWQR